MTEIFTFFIFYHSFPSNKVSLSSLGYSLTPSLIPLKIYYLNLLCTLFLLTPSSCVYSIALFCRIIRLCLQIATIRIVIPAPIFIGINFSRNPVDGKSLFMDRHYTSLAPPVSHPEEDLILVFEQFKTIICLKTSILPTRQFFPGPYEGP